MITYPAIDPVIFSIGPLAVRWYGVTYLAAFAVAWGLGLYRASRPGSSWTQDHIADLVFYGALGVMLGGRIGYVLFYDLERFLNDPIILFAIHEGGMSFHGGLLGVFFALWRFGQKTGRSVFTVHDFAAPLIPVGLGCGRLGNFINTELPGRITDLPWAFVYPWQAVSHLPGVDAANWAVTGRHPSALYQACAEGLLLFAILWLFSSGRRPEGAVAGMFLLGYGVIRFVTEYFREPDAHLGFVAFSWMSMGQLLSLPMVVAGAGIMIWAYRRGRSEAGSGGEPKTS